MRNRDGACCCGSSRNTAVTLAEKPNGTWLHWIWKSRWWQQRIYLWINGGGESGPYVEKFVLKEKEAGLSAHPQMLLQGHAL